MEEQQKRNFLETHRRVKTATGDCEAAAGTAKEAKVTTQESQQKKQLDSSRVTVTRTWKVRHEETKRQRLKERNCREENPQVLETK